MISSLIYYVILLNVSFSFLFFIFFICCHIVFLYATENPTLEDHSNKSSTNVPTLIYPPPKIPLSEEEKLPQHFSKLVNKNTILNLIIASYFINILASPDVSTWSTTGGPMKNKKYIGLTRHH